ncbi:hypothetical protein HDU96_006936 [Phlyctochytrium bullatum]|nr:hypothetical protein HDU96_006936 [Phlyctochytrium bullatum]
MPNAATSPVGGVSQLLKQFKRLERTFQDSAEASVREAVAVLETVSLKAPRASAARGLALRVADLLRLVLQEASLDQVDALPATLEADEADVLEVEDGDRGWNFHVAIFNLMRVLGALDVITVSAPTWATPKPSETHKPIACSGRPKGTFLLLSVKTRNRKFAHAIHEAALSQRKGGREAAADARYTWVTSFVEVRGPLPFSSYESTGKLLDALKKVINAIVVLGGGQPEI